MTRPFVGLLLFLVVALGAWGQGTPDSVLAEINLARTQPGQYAQFLEERRACYGPTDLAIPGQPLVQFKEGLPALDEAIQYLQRQTALPPLTMSSGLAHSAADHVAQMGPAGREGHQGLDNTLPEDRIRRYGHLDVRGSTGEVIDYLWTDPRCIVIDLIVDDGVPNRGHRLCIFNPVYTEAGAALGPHAKYGTFCVVDFASHYVEYRRGN